MCSADTGLAAGEQPRRAIGKIGKLRSRAQVQVDTQLATVVQLPAHTQGLWPQHMCAEGMDTRQVRDDVPGAQSQQLPVEL
ncbi:hypothetical protein D9M71_717000 [compost metagenome]